MKKLFVNFTLIVAVTCFFLPGETFAATKPPLEIPVKGTVTMVDLGAKTCVPCKLMAPILEELKVEYKDRAEVIFIDVWEDRSQGKRFGILSIPTQIFYDKHGKEVYRHAGFYSGEDIKKWLDKLIAEK